MSVGAKRSDGEQSSDNNRSAEMPTSDELRGAISPELQALARKALKDQGVNIGEELKGTIERGLQRPRTVPLHPQLRVPMKPMAGSVPGVVGGAAGPAPAPAPAPSSARSVGPAPAKAAPAPAPSAKSKSSSTLVVVMMGLVACAAAGGAVWQAKKARGITPPVARVEAPAAAATTAPPDTAVTIGTVARPDDKSADVGKSDKAEPTPEPTVAAAAAPVSLPPPPATGTPDEPKPPTTSAAASEPAPKSDATPKPRVAHATPPPQPATTEPRAPVSQAPKKVASADEKKPTTSAPPQPTTAPSVDAILQQQLKSAIP